MKLNLLYIISILLLTFPSRLIGQISKNDKITSQSSISEQVNYLSKSCWDLRERNTDSALILGLKALELAEEYNLDKEIGKLSNYIGVVYFHYQYKYKKSIPYFQKAMKVSLLMKDSLQLAYAYNNLGDVYLATGNIALAQQYGQTSLDIFKKIDHKSGIAYGYINLGELFLKKKEYETSLQYFQEAALFRELVDSSARIGYVFYNQAQAHKDAGNLDSAMSLYKLSLGRSYSSQNHRYVSWCIDGIASIYYIQEEYEKAIEYYEEALQWNLERHHYYSIIDNYLGMALIYAHINKIEEGEALLNKALNIALEMDINSQIIKAYNSYIEFYKILEDFENVTRIFDTFFMQYDSIFTAQQTEIVSELERVFSVEQDLINTEQKLKTNKLLRIHLIVIIILMVVIISVLVWQYLSNKKMNKRLEEMNNTKDKLFSVISHDLKNPFNSLIGLSEILQTSIDNERYEQAKEFASYLNKASIDGLNLLTNLLNWSLSQSGKITFNPETINFDAFFKEIKELYKIEEEKYKVSLVFENKINGEVYADRNILKIILTNLITNALKYTEESGTILIAGSHKNDIITIQVKDNGMGMSQNTIDLLLSKKGFVDSKKGLREERGTGLGLNIISDLIKIHKGKINISSQEGKGSKFEIEIPYKPSK